MISVLNEHAELNFYSASIYMSLHVYQTRIQKYSIHGQLSRIIVPNVSPFVYIPEYILEVEYVHSL